MTSGHWVGKLVESLLLLPARAMLLPAALSQAGVGGLVAFGEVLSRFLSLPSSSHHCSLSPCGFAHTLVLSFPGLPAHGKTEPQAGDKGAGGPRLQWPHAQAHPGARHG